MIIKIEFEICRFYRQLFLFCFYFVLSLISFVLRPGPSPVRNKPTTPTPTTTTPKPSSSKSQPSILYSLVTNNLKEYLIRNNKSDNSPNLSKVVVHNITDQIASNVTSVLRQLVLLSAEQFQKKYNISQNNSETRFENLVNNPTTVTILNSTSFDRKSEVEEDDWYEIEKKNIVQFFDIKKLV